jgi:hypothetical protein
MCPEEVVGARIPEIEAALPRHAERRREAVLRYERRGRQNGIRRSGLVYEGLGEERAA